MIYVTGDTHGIFDKLRAFRVSPEGAALTKKDYVIVLGDFGVWQNTIDEIAWLDSELPYTLMFLDGNHEDFPLLNSMPEKELFSGRVHDLGGVYHLCRGEVYLLPTEEGGKRIAVCGGGTSRDKHMRKEGVDFFPEEEISDGDIEAMIGNAQKYGGRVDAFLSHSPSSEVKLELFAEASFSMNKPATSYIPSESEYKIRDLVGKIAAEKYYSAHEHIDRAMTVSGKEYRIVYNQFLRI